MPPRYLSPALRGPTGDNQGMYQQYVDSHINDMSDEQLSAVVWWLMTVFLTATPRIPVSEGERPVPEWPGGQYQPVGIRVSKNSEIYGKIIHFFMSRL